MGSWQDMADSVMKKCCDTFTTVVLYTPNVGSPVTINTVFNDPYEEGIALDGAPVQTRLYRLGVRKRDLAAAPSVLDKVTIDSITFRVHEIRPDGDAGYVLWLHKDV
jgi:hypothetical protein